MFNFNISSPSYLKAPIQATPAPTTVSTPTPTPATEASSTDPVATPTPTSTPATEASSTDPVATPTPTPTPTPTSTSVCTGLSLTFEYDKTYYIQGETVTYTYSCIPVGTRGAVTIKVDDVTYNSSTNTDTQTAGFGTSNLSVGVHILKACLNSDCLPYPTVSVDFNIYISSSATTTLRSLDQKTINQTASVLEAMQKILNQMLNLF